MKEPEIPQDPQLIKDRTATIIGFAGLLLGLLVNSIVAIKFNDYSLVSKYAMRILFLLATFSLTMCIMSGAATYVAITIANHIDPSKALVKSIKWLLRGFGSITLVVPLILFPDYQGYVAFILYAIGLSLALLQLERTVKKEEQETY